jgi:hypothetical protein
MREVFLRTAAVCYRGVGKMELGSHDVGSGCGCDCGWCGQLGMAHPVNGETGNLGGRLRVSASPTPSPFGMAWIPAARG